MDFVFAFRRAIVTWAARANETKKLRRKWNREMRTHSQRTRWEEVGSAKEYSAGVSKQTQFQIA